eukprot:1144161-Pelagomonas_calceolata.AAC.1
MLQIAMQDDHGEEDGLDEAAQAAEREVYKKRACGYSMKGASVCSNSRGRAGRYDNGNLLPG